MLNARRATIALLAALTLVVGVAANPNQAAPAHAGAMTTGSIVGTVVGPDGPIEYIAGVQGVTVTANPVGSPAPVGYALADSTGAFSMTGVPPGTYNILVRYFGPENILSMWAPGVYLDSQAQVYTVSAGSEHTFNFTLREGAKITGTISLEGGGLGGYVQIGPAPGSVLGSGTGGFRRTSDFATGTYVIDQIVPGSYTLWMYADFSQYWGVQWPSKWGGLGTVTPITLDDFGEVRSGVDVELPRASTIQGVLTVPAGGPSLTGQQVVLRQNGTVYDYDVVGSDGSFKFSGITGDGFTLCTFQYAPRDYIGQTCWHPELGISSDPQPFSVSRTDRYVDLVIPVRTGGRILFDARYGNSDGSAGGWLYGEAILYKLNESDGYWYVAQTVSANDSPSFNERSFSIPAVEPGEYRIELVASSLFEWFGRVYYPGTRKWVEAESITVSEFETIDLGTVIVGDKDFDIQRYFGATRYETAVEISKNTRVSPPVPVVYVASGASYPDALSAGPAAAALGGSLILTPPSGLTPELRLELERLNPERIVVAGGTGSVSLAVERELREFVDDPDNVTRIGGVDRYDTSRRIVADAFEGITGRVVFVATGVNFPDALAAGPAAAHFGGPVLLVRGSQATLDLPTRTLLDSLEPGALVIAGGAGSVSGGIESSLQSRFGADADVIRAPGQNRFETAALINMISFSEAESAIYASGIGFADALAGSTLAASMQAPLYLVTKNCVPEYVRSHVDDLGVFEIRILGGYGVLDEAIDRGVTCAL